MNRLEYTEGFESAIHAAISQRLAGVWTCLPGIVRSYDSSTGTVSVQPTIRGDFAPFEMGAHFPQTLPVLQDVPVVFPGAGDVEFAFPLAPGDEVLLVFASRCIDTWFETGQVENQAEFRMHDLSDGFALPAKLSKPKVAGRSATVPTIKGPGNCKVVFENGGITLDGKVKVTGQLEVASSVAAQGAITSTSSITAQGNVTAMSGPAQVTLALHKHAGNGMPPIPGS